MAFLASKNFSTCRLREPIEIFSMALVLSLPVVALDQFVHILPVQWLGRSLIGRPPFVAAARPGR